MPSTSKPAAAETRSQPRNPLLWAALAYAAGTLYGTHVWRPALWWLASTIIFLGASSFFLRHRPRLAQALALGAFVCLGAVALQLPSTHPALNDQFSFAEAGETTLIGHVSHEGAVRPARGDGLRQSLDLEIETGNAGRRFAPIGVQLTMFSGKGEAAEFRPLHYGEKVRFTAQLRQPRNYRNSGAFDYEGYLAEKGIFATAVTASDKVERLTGFEGNLPELWRARIHRRIVEKIHEIWSPPQAALIDAMVIGEDAFVDRDTRADFQRSGTYHILVVSGINVGILAFVVFWLLRRLRASELAASVITLLLTLSYAYVTEVGAPIWRAALMMAVYLGVRVLYRQRSMLNAIGATALVLMLRDPAALKGASFQLTFLCVLMIAGAGIPLLERTSIPYQRGLHLLESVTYDFSLPPRTVQFRLDLRLLMQRLRLHVGSRLSRILVGGFFRSALSAFELVAISVLMQAGLALPMAFYFHRVTPLGLPANLIVVPLTALLMPAAVAAVALGFVSRLLARVPAAIAGSALYGITGSVRWLGGVRTADLRVPTPSLVVVIAGILALGLALVLARRRWQYGAFGLAAVVATALWIAFAPGYAHVRPGVLEVTSIDVGQGDSHLLITPEGKTLLLDAGGPTGGPHLSEFDVGEEVVSPYLWSRGFRRLDAIAISHAHSDHMGGMMAVLRNFRPAEMWLSVVPAGGELAPLIEEARRLNVRVIQYSEGDAFHFGGAEYRVLSPPRGWQSTRAQNNDSLVLHVSVGNTAALLEGDAETAAEQRIAQESPSAGLLKVGHHGGRNATTPELLRVVRPGYALISVGRRNLFGMPRPEVLQRLEAQHVTVFRTDIDGAVSFYLDGRTITAGLADRR